MRPLTSIRLQRGMFAVSFSALVVLTGCGPAIPSAGQSVATSCPGVSCTEQILAAAQESRISTSLIAVEVTPATLKIEPIATPAFTPDATPVSAASPNAYESAAAVLGPVIWATEVDPDTRAPNAAVTVFDATTQTIYATVAVERASAGTRFSAQWTYNRTRLESFDSSIATDSGFGAGSGSWLEFHLALSEPESWPTGTYEIDVLVNGEPGVHGSVEVRAPGG